MKIVVTGASGSVGTAVLRALRQAEDIDEVVGIARRVPPRTPPAPYDVARWVGLDVGAKNTRDVVSTLGEAMHGADAVIHLSWAIQPSHHRERLRRTNVLGAQRMLAAARDSKVPHVVVASSVGAYSPDADGSKRRDESWPRNGVPTCEYSVDKADVERLLDAHERAHPHVLITRLRPALIFQRVAGSEILRYFFGPTVPPSIFGGRAPVLPWPHGMRLQAVHADDVAQAYLSAVRRKPGGAFNISAEDVLGGEQIASLLSHGRLMEVPRAAFRGAVAAAWNTRIVPVSPGWIDMALAAPLMDTSRARAELGWSARHSALDTVAEIFRGMDEGAGTPSPPLRPR